MKKLIILSTVLAIFTLTSCDMETGTIQVENRVHNVRLESINFGQYQVSYSLLPGEKSNVIKITDYKEDFPKTGPIEFIMTRDGNRVYLKTKMTYVLNYDEDILVIIADSTEVVNPLVKKTSPVYLPLSEVK
jgi:hypothetical protein